ncbi:kinase-like domain-containing protein [Radiomyces spectabilis]|uniref:kinase-like domain-containing protein n=1 Tax=Radiomyces spectabilis TaxID=64574 RepID=UPI00221FE22C|nr:kinase-like domain-containing protein [Radiomyces spectabilis]KAI8371756.1 kinase-like domain-containing protein [Radiomyces spectabilis]
MSQPSQDEPTNRSTSPTGPPQPPTNVTNIDDPSHPLFHHRRSVGDFTYGDVLGEGSYSTVLLARDKKTDKQYAIKKLDKAHIVKNDKVKYVMIERDALSRMNHPGIVKLYWTFKDNRSLYYVLDLAPNGELYTYIRRLAPFSLETARFYAAEIVLALEHIHSKGVVHRDIKPENILFDEHMHIKITDFGSAKILQDNQEETPSQSNARSFVGTAEYVSPELLRSDPTSKEADLWALGCVIFQMISGKSPFKAATDYLIFQKIKNLDYTFPEEFPPVARDLVEKLLVPEASQRLGAGNIDLLKQHPFFEGVPWDTLFESQAPPLKEQLAEELRKHPPAPEIEDDNDMDIWFGEENPFSDAAAPQSNPEPKMNMTDNYASEPGMPDNRRSHSTPYDGSYSPARASLDQSSVTRSSTSDRPRDDLNNPW